MIFFDLHSHERQQRPHHGGQEAWGSTIGFGRIRLAFTSCRRVHPQQHEVKAVFRCKTPTALGERGSVNGSLLGSYFRELVRQFGHCQFHQLGEC